MGQNAITHRCYAWTHFLQINISPLKFSTRPFIKEAFLSHLVLFTGGLTLPLAEDAVELILVDCFFRDGLGGEAPSSSSLIACFLFDPALLCITYKNCYGFSNTCKYNKTVCIPSNQCLSSHISDIVTKPPINSTHTKKKNCK